MWLAVLVDCAATTAEEPCEQLLVYLAMMREAKVR